jgi:choline dehydrogenase-like flavoprotein
MRDVPADVVVVGAGASGPAAAWRLASAGLRVVLLEQGGWLDQRASPSLTLEWEEALQTRFHPDPNIRALPSDYPVLHEGTTPIRPALFTGVGGSTLRWGAHFPRFRPSDFRARTLDGVAEDWPISYDDLEPYFALNDAVMGVPGLKGDPANPPRGDAPRLPPLPLGPGPQRLAEAFDRLGWHWWPSDAAVLTAPQDGREACNLCGPCGLGCPRHARASGDVTWMPRALAAGVELRTGARALRVEPGGVHYARGGERRFQAARSVVMAASGLGTPRLLLASGFSHPLLGRHLMHHPTAIVTGIFHDRLDGHKGPFACAFASQEFIETDASRGFLRGYQMQALRGGGPVQTALGGYMARLPWGRGHHAAFGRVFGHSVSITVTAEDLPDPENRVTLDESAADSDGLPAARLHYRLHPNSRAMLDHGIARAEEALREAGAIETMVNPLVAAAGFHFLGTARMGSDPATSVVDEECRLRGAEDIVLVDGSVFVTAGGVNPTSTIQAVALRAADLLARRLA